MKRRPSLLGGFGDGFLPRRSQLALWFRCLRGGWWRGRVAESYTGPKTAIWEMTIPTLAGGGDGLLRGARFRNPDFRPTSPSAQEFQPNIRVVTRPRKPRPATPVLIAVNVRVSRDCF